MTTRTRTRITLTKAETDLPAGRSLINMILSVCHDGELSYEEVVELHLFLVRDRSGIAAIQFLRSLTREVVGDGKVGHADGYKLKRAFERVVPKEARGVVSTHLEGIGLPGF